MQKKRRGRGRGRWWGVVLGQNIRQTGEKISGQISKLDVDKLTGQM